MSGPMMSSIAAKWDMKENMVGSFRNSERKSRRKRLQIPCIKTKTKDS